MLNKHVVCSKPIHRLKNLINNILLFGLAFAATLLPARAQEPVIHFDHLTLDNGLSDNTVYAIVQDQTGFMWFGTQNGLNKYDGYRFTVYRSDPFNPNTVSNDNAGNIYIDHDGYIWIGTWGGGVDRLDPRTGQFKNYTTIPNDPNSLNYDRVQTIFQDSRGTIWIGTAGGGLNKLDPKTDTFTHYLPNPNNPFSISNDRIWRIDEDREGYLWIATTDGLNKFDPDTDKFTHYFHDPADPASLSHSLIRTLHIDRAGVLWVGTEKGLNRFNADTGTFTAYFRQVDNPTSLSDDIINAILEDSHGRFWVGTRSGGLNLMDRATGTFTHFVNDPLNSSSLAYNDIRYIFEDNGGVLWIGTRGGGVDKLVPTSGQFIHYAGIPGHPSTIANNEVRAIYQDDDGSLWLGNKGGGLTIYNSATGQYTSFAHNPDNPNSLSSDDIYAIYKDSAGIFWLGTAGGGLNSYNPAESQFTRYPFDTGDSTGLSSTDVNVIFEDRARYLWIGTKGGGLDRFDRATQTFTAYQNDPANPASLANNDVYAIYQDPAGQLWIGTYGGGLNKFDPVTEQFVRFQYNPENLTSLSDNNIYHIYQSAPDAMWLATANGGLNKFDPQTGHAVSYTQADGLASDVVYSILNDDAGNLWLSTSKGLTKFVPAENRFVNYGITDGLQRVMYREDSAFKGRDGALYFGGINGLTKFYPDKIGENMHVPPVVITGLSLFNQPLNLDAPPESTRDIQLSYQDDVLSFDFAALDYVAPEKNQYAYMLEGFDHDWNYAGPRTFATYTNLDPGDYTFKVKGANNAGVWNDDGISVSLVITPPFWETWWFRTLAVAGLLAIGFVTYKLRVRVIEHQRNLLKKKVAERTAALLQANQHLQEVTNRLQDELALAKKIQQGLLPPARPRWSHPEVVCFSKPAREVGGDFYDYYAVASEPGGPPEHFAVIVGDVSGKGMPAALLMAVSLGSLQSIVAQSPKKEELLFRLDSTLKPYTQTTNQNCALCYTEYNNGSLSVINAGGVPPFVRSGNGQTRWLDAIGLPLGVILERKPNYREATVNVAVNPGDMVVLVSDGVIEAMDETGEMYGFERLEQAIAAGPQQSAADMLNHLKETVHNFLGPVDAADDLTIVVVKV